MRSIDLIIFGIKRGYPDTKSAYLELAEILRKNFDVRIIEVLNVIGEYTNQRSKEVSIKQNLEYFFTESIKIQRDFRCDKNYEK